MQAGKLDTLILIERKSVATNPTSGVETITWESLVLTADSPPAPVKIWAEVQDALPSKAESVVAGVGIAKSQTRCRLRWRNDIDSSMRVTVYRDPVQVYQIVGGPSDVDGRRVLIELMLEKYSS